MSGTADRSSAEHGLVRPPRLRTGESAGASNLELFFDVAYVWVVLELASSYLDDLTWHGTVVIGGLFAAIWFSWMGFTLYANRFDTDDVMFRLAKLTATLAVAGCAASADGATTDLSTPFGLCYLGTIIVLALLHLRTWWHLTDNRASVAVYAAATTVSAAVWAAGMFAGGPPRYVCWAVAVLIGASGPVLATLRGHTLPLLVDHLAERFGLWVILVLGEAVGGVARGVHDVHWNTTGVTIALLGFVLVASLWWNYFDVTGRVAEANLRRSEERERADGGDGQANERHDLFIYGHLPLTLGVVLTGVGIEALVIDVDAGGSRTAEWLLSGGVTLFLVGAAVVVGGTVRRWTSIWPWPGAVVVIPPVIAVSAGPALVTVGALAAVLAMAAAYATIRSARRSNARSHAAPASVSPD